MTGPDRATLYRVALGTGFRAAELASLTTASFRLNSEPPTIVCEAAYTKNGRHAEQPIPDALADLLAPWLHTRVLDRPVFKMPRRTAPMIRVDLAAAGIAYETASGVIDFHALRGTYISHLVSSGVSVKTCQTLARHSTPSLTIGVYAKASLHDIEGAMRSLPDLTAPERETLAATGTDGVGRAPLSDTGATGDATPADVDGSKSISGKVFTPIGTRITPPRPTSGAVGTIAPRAVRPLRAHPAPRRGGSHQGRSPAASHCVAASTPRGSSR